MITSIVSTPSADTLPFPEFLRLLSRTDVETTALLRANAARYTFERLPFYDGAGWLRAIVMLPQRPVEFRYVYARGGTVALDRRLMPLGTPARVAAAGCG